MFAGNTGYDIPAEAAIFEQSSRMFDGVILCTPRLNDPVVDRAIDLGIPVVSVHRRTSSYKYGATVNDRAAGMRMLVDAIVAHGHRDISAPQGPSIARASRGPASRPRHPRARSSARPPRLRVADGCSGRKTRCAGSSRPAHRPPNVIVGVSDLATMGALELSRQRGPPLASVAWISPGSERLPPTSW
jgi:LacI family transcriptional regulator